jgi:Ser-tRNA(Ala) deacylase AlaX
MQMHTCLHVLSSVVEAPITGCSISTDRGRLDFDIPESTLDKEQISSKLNDLISGASAVKTHEVGEDEFADYQKYVKTVNIAPPRDNETIRIIEIDGIDLQPCGGTHVKNTNEIPPVFCDKIVKKGKANRRVSLAWK